MLAGTAVTLADNDFDTPRCNPTPPGPGGGTGTGGTGTGTGGGGNGNGGSGGSGGSDGNGAGSAPRDLPITGADSLWTGLVGGLLVVGGLALRRRPSGPGRHRLA